MAFPGGSSDTTPMDIEQESPPEPSEPDPSELILQFRSQLNLTDKSTMTREEVIEKFIQPVEEAFGAGSLEYAEFLELMFDFVDKRADIQVVRSRIRLLFKEHPQLVASFDTYFPAEVQAQNDRPLIQAVVDAESVRFLNNIRMAYMHDEGRYKAFLDIVCGHQSANKDIHDLYKEVCILFHDRPDLIATFRKFLPVS
ncbi:hypothetical protein Vadar_022025 [Vaccinium darrowii]|uniref:Uncharacterized protein n=1 Tax=Vaccinium darrowii TaxID=229202 RepID=A0ACB7ZKH7_9ERIC|nr:hypothetical protein Vadar_022025 [Vaccinium darrowii]